MYGHTLATPLQQMCLSVYKMQQNNKLWQFLISALNLWPPLRLPSSSMFKYMENKAWILSIAWVIFWLVNSRTHSESMAGIWSDKCWYVRTLGPFLPRQTTHSYVPYCSYNKTRCSHTHTFLRTPNLAISDNAMQKCSTHAGIATIICFLSLSPPVFNLHIFIDNYSCLIMMRKKFCTVLEDSP